MKDERDQKLSPLIQSLQAPAPRPSFHERMWARIDAEDRAKERAGERPRRRWAWPRRRTLAVAMSTTVLAVCAALALSDWPATETLAPVGAPPAAASVIEKMETSMAAYRSLSAVFFYERAELRLHDVASPGTASQQELLAGVVVQPIVQPLLKARVSATSDGRMRTTSVVRDGGTWTVPRAGATVYDTPGLYVQVRNQPRGYFYEAWMSDRGLRVTRTVDAAPGPPDAQTTTWFPWFRGMHSGPLSPLAYSGGHVEATTYEGRPALSVTAAVPPQKVTVDAKGVVTSQLFDQFEMIVDRRTWLPVRIAKSFRGSVVEAWGYTGLRLDVPVAEADFAPAMPDVGGMEENDAGFRRVSLKDAVRTSHGRMLAPTRVPAGFQLSLVTVREGYRGPDVATTEPPTAEASDVVSLVYRKGFRSIVVTTRHLGIDEWGASNDPFAGVMLPNVAGGPGGATTVRLTRGGLAGSTANVRTRAFELPHLWVRQDGLLVTVAGDVSRKDLVRLAASLQPPGVGRTQQVVARYIEATAKDDRAALARLYDERAVLSDRTGMTSFHGTSQVLDYNSDLCATATAGTTIDLLVGNGLALWEAYLPDPVVDSFAASAELIRVRNGRIVSADFYFAGTSGDIGPPESLAPSRRDPLPAAQRAARSYAAAIAAKDAAALAAQAAPDVRFLDIDYGDRGGRDALLARYERMFARPADLAFKNVHWFAGPGWAVVTWTATSPSLVVKAGGLTVLETRSGRVARETVYCSHRKMPFD